MEQIIMYCISKSTNELESKVEYLKKALKLEEECSKKAKKYTKYYLSKYWNNLFNLLFVKRETKEIKVVFFFSFQLLATFIKDEQL